MFRILGIVFVVLIGIFVIAIVGGLFGSSAERDLAREFMNRVSVSDYAGMREMMHESLAVQFPDETLAEGLANVATYTEVTFSGFETNTSGTKVDGTAVTADGCESPVTFTFVNEVLMAFNIETVCRN